MGPGVQKYDNMHENLIKMSRQIEKVKSPKTDSPDLTPEGLGGTQGAQGGPGGP